MSFLTMDQLNKLVRIRDKDTREAIRKLWLRDNYKKNEKDMQP